MGMKKTEVGMIPEEWNVQIFSDTFRILNNNTFSRAELNYESGQFRNIHYGDVLIRFPEVLDCTRLDVPYINDDCRISGSAQALQDGDVVIADTAEDETVGKVTEVRNTVKKPVMAGLHTIPCRVKSGEFAPMWLGYYMNSHLYHDQLLPYIHGIKVSSVSKGSLAETVIIKPPIEEQKKIVAALSDMDALIKDTEKLIRKYQAVKQACLQRMFPQNGQNEPEMRLPGFTGAWEQRELGDMMNITSVKRIHQSDWTDSGVRFLRARDIVSASKNEKPDDYLYISQEKYEEYSTISGKVDIDDLLVTGVGTIGVPYLVKNLEPLYFKDGNIIWFQNNHIIDGKFFYYSFIGKGIQSFIKASAGTGTVGTYTIDTGKKTPIQLPGSDEQKKIGDYFNSLDHLITLHQRKLKKYKDIKQGMMEELLTGKVRLS
ncbi:MAG: restriction endonuclease subunit S [Clostridiales bacterium]|nr:restriction endonuclease subunit S [Clostridiales bacterium]